MRIRGYINHGYRPPAPFVAVTASLQELNIQAKLPLLLDTGASSTIILWRDVERLKINTTLIRMTAAKAYLELSEKAKVQRLRRPSLADGIILASGRALGAKIVTRDEHFKGLAEVIYID